MKTLLTLTFIENNGEILLGYKKRGFGEGRWNGFGGKVKENEDIEVGARREIKEEAEISVRKLEKQAIISFTFEHKPEKVLEVHVFRTKEYSGEPQESEEMRPEWFLKSEIPLEKFWDADKIWLPQFLVGKKLIGKFHYSKDESLISHELHEVDSLI